MSSEQNRVLNFFQTEFGVDQKVMNDVLAAALSRGGDFAELYFEHRLTSNMRLEEGSVKDSTSGIIQGVGIRVVMGDSFGYAYSEDFSPESMKHAAITASQIAKGSKPGEPVDAALFNVANRYPVATPSVDVRALEKLELLRRADKAARAYDPAVKKVIAMFAEEYKQIMIATSDGRLAADIQPLVSLRVFAIAERDGKNGQGFESAARRYSLDYFSTNRTPEEIGKEAARIAVQSIDAVDAPAGMFPVVLAAGHSGVLLHEAVGHGLEADFNRKKLSNYSDRVGEIVASSLCTVVDDGTIEFGKGTLNVDDEGNIPQYNVLIENGQLAGYLQDRISSKYYDNKLTGSGRRQSFRHSPMPRMSNTYMLAGESTFDELVSAVDKGLYCVSYSGGQVNIHNGDFTFGVTEAYMIENGKITVPVKNVNLIGNGPDVLSKVTMVANDFALAEDGGMCGKNGQMVPVGVGMPSVLVSSITVGGTAA
jgi:TldD protein